MLNLDRVLQLAELRGESLDAVSMRAGSDRKYLYNLRRGRTDASKIGADKIAKLAIALHVPVDVICNPMTPTNPTIHRCDWHDNELVDLFWMSFRKKTTCLTLNSRPDCMILPEAMYEWLWFEHDTPAIARQGQTWNPHWVSWARGFYEIQARYRHNSSISYTLITREDHYLNAAARDLTFLERSYELLRNMETTTSVGLVPSTRWEWFYRQIASLISTYTCLPPFRWNKVSIIDDFILLIRSESFHYLISFDAKTVKSVRDNACRLASEAIQWDLQKVMANTYARFSSLGVKRARAFGSR